MLRAFATERDTWAMAFGRKQSLLVQTVMPLLCRRFMFMCVVLSRVARPADPSLQFRAGASISVALGSCGKTCVSTLPHPCSHGGSCTLTGNSHPRLSSPAGKLLRTCHLSPSAEANAGTRPQPRGPGQFSRPHLPIMSQSHAVTAS